MLGTFLLLIVSLVGALGLVGWSRVWVSLGLPSMSPPFADMRVVKAGWLREEAGISPRVLDAHDPWNRPMNYPLIWAKFGGLFGFAKENAFLAFTAFWVILFWAVCGWVIYRYPNFYTLSFPFSFACLLAVERGNTDLVIVTPLFLAAYGSPALAAAAILLGAALKIFPCFAVGALLKSRWIFLLTVCLTGAFILWRIPEVRELKALTPESGWWSYGASSLSLSLEPKLNLRIPVAVIQALVAAATLACFLVLRRKSACWRSSSDAGTERLFMAGAGIYIGTFFFTSSWDYRMVFLLLCLPWLSGLRSAWIRHLALGSTLLAANQIYLCKIPMDLAFLANLLAKALLFVLLAGLALNLTVRPQAEK